MTHNPRYPLKHLSIRVPWHDNKWNGTICNNPQANGACLVLKNCALNRDDEKEQLLAGKSIENLEEENFPVCIGERATFMAPFSFTRTLKHPYAKSSPESHGHLKPTTVNFPAYSGAAVPYHWLLKGNAMEKAEVFDLNFDLNREPRLSWAKNGNDNWVQETENQRALLNCFFEHLEEDTSLVFFYTKQMPFVEESGRVLAGVGRINKIIPSGQYEGSNKRFGASYWEHMIMHSIREHHKDGFLLPYHEAINYQKENPSFDVADLVVIVPGDKQFEFSYASEHVSNDSAIRVLLDCVKSLEKAQELGIGENNSFSIKWIHDEIAKLEKLRGHYPGMGAALCAFGIEKGHFVAAEIINKLKDENENPWKLFEKVLDSPEGILSDRINELIPYIAKKLYKRLKEKSKPVRIKYLHLLSRFDLSIEQAKTLFVQEEREKIGVNRKDEEYLRNPYLIYEDLRQTLNPVSLNTIDLGLFLKVAENNLLPDQLLLEDPYDLNRIRALTIQQLEYASLQGHTLLPRKELIKKIRDLAITPPCEINSDYYELAEESFDLDIVNEEMKNGEVAYQLARYRETRTIISQNVSERIQAKRHSIKVNWKELLNKALAEHTEGDPDEQEKRAREEKAIALREIAENRFSVLIGPAGTGKTTLLTILAGHEEIESNGVLFLAPTGKARVRMEEVARNIKVTAKTLAQFLIPFGRYNGEIQQYKLSEQYCEGTYQTVILDEASMLTEEMLATTLDCLKGVKRFILVGDHRQLPPIGAGRPFLDIIHHLRPNQIESQFPRIGRGYAELNIKRRQGGAKREDIQLAEWFSGEPLEPGADSIINHLINTPNTEYLRIEHWENESDFEKLFNAILVDELKMSSIEDVETFNKSLGSSDGRYFNFREAVKKVESWQILSPVREKIYGVRAINRKIHKQFRKDKVEYARTKFSKIPLPIGLEEIVYGDKVINLVNSKRNAVWPSVNSINYIANGEIGTVIGQFKTSKMKFPGRPKNTEIEFTTQKGFKYTFKGYEFAEEGNNPLELAYALTVHKAQGSEFGKVFIVIPNPCFLLSREMIYTALTRQKDKVILLLQGNSFDIKELASPTKSDALKRMTNLFEKPELVEIEGEYLEKNLIQQATDGKMLRSKSELLIYQRLLDKKLNPLYEKKLVIKEVEKLPDFTIENDNTGEIYYWEHCGMLFDAEYKKRWDEKYQWYIENNILPYEQGGGENGTLIVTEDKPSKVEGGETKGSISMKEIDIIIEKVFAR
ncbi:ATP-dependent exoDNAse (exonuclease V) alpha subunit [Zeaxanthinibacter enoshimensis]|uniref:ATP-dependent exoDNAse (Exonuclease V) alpha subunit n=2 Tax=Zeaxanthinibacter enoshimensis TaxID=392009 RepID=A0A4R6TT49_9FLAO|nr:ATP-dependent exoDNAse (exonuclease V) alpha subunit [Zeaxanthinibacter enoshimensis]